MTLEKFTIEIPETERRPLVNWLLKIIAEQQQTIEKQQQTIAKLSKKVNSQDEELKAVKKLKGRPKISPSTLNSDKKNLKKSGKRPGSEKRSKKQFFAVDEERIIEPEAELPIGVTFNGYRGMPLSFNAIATNLKRLHCLL